MGIEVELSNLDKVLYPVAGVTKGDIVAYYSAIAPAMLPHVAGRPVTRKRWPDGVASTPFFEKNLPRYAPSWIARRSVMHSSREVVYPLIESEAALVWLAQQAALELHVPQWRFEGDRRGAATRLVFDLDPGDGAGLVECAEVAVAVRDMVEGIGLRVFPVTSGSKGIHLYVPLDRDLGPGGCTAVAKKVATNLARLHPDLVTAVMAKSARRGKVFLDWSQNNASKTTVAPYSLRGRQEPYVAAPRTWNEVEARKTLRQIRFDEVVARFRSTGDPLAELDPVRASGTSVVAQVGVDALARYRSMRDSARTPEPVPAESPRPGTNDRFVVQRHEARRLHWDVRLERDGVLVSWAVPKGPPTSPTQNRLAVRTEDHPMEYLDFHGVIPRGEYGAGEVTTWDSGTYSTEKWHAGEVVVRFHGTRLIGRYALIRTDGDHWLMHRMRSSSTVASMGELGAEPQESGGRTIEPRTGTPPPRGLAPMLATAGDIGEFDSDDWCFETKWDGFRVLAEVDSGALTVRSRAGHVVTERYPAMAALARELSGHRLVFDGEAVVFDDRGVANLGLLQADSRRAVFVAFDVLYADGISLLGKRYIDRRHVLEVLAAHAPSLVVPPCLAGSGAQALRYSREHHLEGVVAKRKDSVYLPGTRGHSWVKQRNWRTQAVVIGGWRRSAARNVKSVLVGVLHDGRLFYLGRVGAGFTAADIADLSSRLPAIECESSPFHNDLTASERREVTWVTPKLGGAVRFMDWTRTGRLWHPVWLGTASSVLDGG
ncbi:ATP-dependent DNA ligase [Nocardia sp. CNY236]|uniref:ATP-dependent DNA ligase n=1 Tax=Nocardia sp. CNY236 TaxID=1169152 RepID=UPI000417EBC8|nr:ATP-dependent DNA ligase [Nocardia sp. CNY236]